ncbi:MAG: hypothetical protein AMS18_09400 [Gemmatimonas sp. SG8_17]|nr:MAG: hypothetical protein AMS18_09400 [Gemmatimonas sp. SG8_17]
MNGKSKGWALTLLLGVLLLGGVAGATLDRVLIRQTASDTRSAGRHRDRQQGYLEWLTSELDLTQDQQAQVRSIIEEHREQISAIWLETRPRYDELQSRARAEIRQALTQEQQLKYEALLERQAERRRDRRNNGNSRTSED